MPRGKNKRFTKPRSAKSTDREESWEDKESRDMKRDRKKRTKSTNDPKWYASDAALLRDSASIPFSWPIGQAWNRNLPVNPYTGEDWVDPSGRITKQNLPGVCALYIDPCFGANLDSDALNVAASSMYTYVRHTNAGHANYDPNDLMLYVCAMTQVYSYVNYLMRTYAIATLYEQKNRYLPDMLFRACYIDPDSIKNNLADFRYGINVLINKVSSIAVPATMPIFNRHAMLYAYIYGESESVKDQLYMYCPEYWLEFDLDDDEAGMLKAVTVPRTGTGSLSTWQDLIKFGNDLFSAIWEQEDFGIMSGDILKSYGDNILKISSLDEYLPFNVLYDPMVLHQIKNATPWNPIFKVGIEQNSSKSKLIAICEAYGVGKWNTISYCVNTRGGRILTLDSVEPTPEMVIEATRLMTGPSDITFEGSENTIKIYGASEVVHNTFFWFYNQNGNLNALSYSDNSFMCYWLSGVDTPHSTAHLLRFLEMHKHFKFAPMITISTFPDENGNTPGDVVHMQEVDNFAVLDYNDTSKMHTAAMLNLLNVPSAAKNVRV